MVQISTEISTLTKAEREQLAGFILTFGLSEADQQQQRLPFADKVVSIAAPPAPAVEAEAGDIQPNPADVFPLATDAAAPAPPAPAATGPQLVIGAAAGDGGVAAVTLDKNNFPWDERIHAGGKALNADGTWRKKRGVTETLIAEVEGQLRQLAPPPPPPAATSGPALVQAPPPPAPNADLRGNFVALVGRVSAAISAGKLTQEEAVEICKMHGVEGIPLLATKIESVKPVSDAIDMIIASKP